MDSECSVLKMHGRMVMDKALCPLMPGVTLLQERWLLHEPLDVARHLGSPDLRAA